MSTALKFNLVSIDDYLAGEAASPVKHEFLGGVVYAMAGARNTHNRLKGNIFGALHLRLRGKRFEVWDSDTKIRIHLPDQVRFYYPDDSVVRKPNPEEDSFQDRPVVLFEVLSQKTRRIDEGEKKDAYLTIPSLSVYVLVEQEAPAMVVFRRTPQGFVREVYAGLDAVLPLGEIDTSLPLSEIYAGAEFTPEAPDDDGV